MKKLVRKNLFIRNLKQTISLVLMLIILFTSIGLEKIVVNAEDTMSDTIIYLIDNTPEKWLGNNNAVIELVDNSSGHDRYIMTKSDDVTWSVKVPKSAYNITFNRYSSDKTTQWNSWSAGGRDSNNAFYADGSEYGHWDTVKKRENYFHAGDIVYLDLTEFEDWEKDNALIYINFSDASKEQNNGKDIVINSADKEKYNPIKVNSKINEGIYAYELTEAEEGKTSLRFWRGSETSLWNCSECLSYEEYSKGNDCIKISGWNNASYLVKTGLLKADSDKDGLSNVLEIQLGTDMYDADTDGDGLDDAYEYYYLMTDPVKTDTDGNGISDYDEDFDKDGLINGLEYVNGTDPYKKDTDEDGLDDYNEIIKYGTNALKYDTDEDGLSDMEDMNLVLTHYFLILMEMEY